MLFRTITLHTFLLLAALMTQSAVQASHISGGDISYTCLGSGQYRITLNLYRDCSGISMGTTQTIDVNNDCGYPSQTLTATLVTNSITGENFTNVSQLCLADSLNNTCYGGSLPGMQKYTYEVTVTLTQTCDSFRFSWGVCCRNSSNNLIGQVSPYFEATLNNSNAVCNNSPRFTAHPIPYVCVNQPVSYNYGILESDGDNLVYSLIDARSAPSSAAPYETGFSGASPIDGIVVDSLTGEIQFTPTTVGYYVVVMSITEYDNGGDYIGTVFRDMQFVVQNCSNTIGDYSALLISGVTGDASLDSDNNIQICEGSSFCFDLTFTDPDPIDVVSLTSNVETVLPGATFSWVSSGNSATATVCWTAVSGVPSVNVFSIEISDNACPIEGISYYTKQVTFVENTSAGADQTLCEGDEVTLTASGGTDFTWNLISGDPLVVGTNISCTNCASTLVSPNSSSTYQLVNNTGIIGCSAMDTITVDVVPTFNHSVTPNRDTVCLNETLNYSTSVPSGGVYSYSWSPTTFIDDPTSGNPTVHATAAGIVNHVVSIQNSYGCTKMDTIVLLVSTEESPEVSITLTNDTIHIGDTVATIVEVGSGIPSISGLSSSNTCGGTGADVTIGTSVSTNSVTSYPAPYGNWYKNAKHQFLYTADELNTMGFMGGKITEIGWEITQVNGTTVYNDFTIRMGTTSSMALTDWESGLETVFTPQAVNVTTGYNMHTLTNAYDWDGSSNLVVEICFNNLSLGYTYNSYTPYETTGYNSVLYYRSDGAVACNATSYTASDKRPVTKFRTCDVVVDLNNYDFSWTPASTLTDGNISNPSLHPVYTTTYNLETTDVLTGCRSTDETTLIVLPNPFPVELLFFEAEADDRSKQVDISWATLSETNNDHFIIQRSKDGRDWEEIIEVQGAGTSVSEIRYSTEDRNPHHGVSYYRLKQVNDDGKTTHSSIRAVTFDLPYLFAPNPSSGMISVNADEYSNSELEIIDMQGKLVFSQQISGLTRVNLSNLPDGVYILKVRTGDMINFDRLILENSNQAGL